MREDVEYVAKSMYENVGPTVHSGNFGTFSRDCRAQEWAELPTNFKRIVRMNARQAIIAIRKFDSKKHDV